MHIVVLFQCGLDSNAVYETSYTTVTKLKCGELYNSSKARNTGIQYVREHDLKASYVMFPDDDSTFDKAFFDDFLKEVHSDTLINVFCKGTSTPYQHMLRLRYLGKTDNYQNAMAVNMIIMYDHFMEVGFFDERMEVGARYGSGEDGDFFLRICELFEPFTFNQRLHTFHPASNTKYATLSLMDLMARYKKYGEGAIFMLCKHKKYGQAIYATLKRLLGAFKALIIDFDGKLCLARMAGFYYRSKMLLALVGRNSSASTCNNE